MTSTLLPSIPVATRINVIQPTARWLHRPRLADSDADVAVITNGMRAQCTNRAAGRRFSWCTCSSGCGEMGPQASGHCFYKADLAARTAGDVDTRVFEICGCG